MDPAAFALSGLAASAVKLDTTVTATGAVTPLGLVGSRVALTEQRNTGATWTPVKSIFASLSPNGKYSWKYKPVAKGAYRMRAATAKTSVTRAASTKWVAFAVR